MLAAGMQNLGMINCTTGKAFQRVYQEPACPWHHHLPLVIAPIQENQMEKKTED